MATSGAIVYRTMIYLDALEEALQARQQLAARQHTEAGAWWEWPEAVAVDKATTAVGAALRDLAEAMGLPVAPLTE
jgi:hypothetical protein